MPQSMQLSPRRGRYLELFLIPLAAVLLSGCTRQGDPVIHEMLAEVSEQNIRSHVRRLAEFGTRHTLSETDSDTRGIGAARRWIHQQFESYRTKSGDRLRVELQSFIQPADGRRITRDVEIINVIATLPGEDPAKDPRVFVVSGHYDSICSDPTDHLCDAPGANDDASGVAAVLEMARVMSKRRFRATLVFAAVAGEEQGLFGSRYMAARYRDEGVQIAGMFTNDIIGNTLGQNGIRNRSQVRVFSEGVPVTESSQDARQIRLATGNENDSPARQLARYVDEVCKQYLPGFEVLLVWRRDRFLRGGDHTAFSEQGYPAIRFTEVNEDYRRQHQNVRLEDGIQYGDLPDFVDDGYITQVTKVNLASLASLALAPPPPQKLRVLTTKLEHTTTLQWEIPNDDELSGYEIVWRETTAPRWQHSQYVGIQTGCVHPLSKDNYTFGVRAVGKNGHKSVVAYPLPARE